jgi:hypothetical protein
MPTVLLGSAVGAAVVYGINEGDPMAVQKKVRGRPCTVCCSHLRCEGATRYSSSALALVGSVTVVVLRGYVCMYSTPPSSR